MVVARTRSPRHLPSTSTPRCCSSNLSSTATRSMVSQPRTLDWLHDVMTPHDRGRSATCSPCPPILIMPGVRMTDLRNDDHKWMAGPNEDSQLSAEQRLQASENSVARRSRPSGSPAMLSQTSPISSHENACGDGLMIISAKTQRNVRQLF